MKKSILVILLVLLAFTVWTVLAFGKATNKENLQQPTQIQKAELSPGPEEFPAVVLPKAKPTKPTTEDFQKLMLEKKGITPEMLEQRKLDNVPAEDFEALEKEPLTLCTIGNQQLPCCYRSTPDNLYLRCWGAVSTATFMDPDNNGYGMAVCPYPIYPFNATKVAMALNTSDTCTVVFRPEIWSAAYIDHSPYPDAPIWIGPEYTFKPAGGTNTTYLSLGADVCLYDRWFAVITYMNTDDRYDPDYCPDGNAIPDYQSWIFDIAGRLEQSYWAPYAEYGYPYGFFDVVENGICSGAIRVRTQGYNRPENACPILPDNYYYKVGLPDFYQYQAAFPNNGMAYCGPVAGANSIWWFACIDSQFTPSWGGCNPGDEIALINEIAAAAGTDPVLGTNCDALEAAIIGVIKAHGGWNFIETTVYAPEFWYLQYQLRICEDVVLLLGFWQFDGANWTRFGGHFVTLAGVDYVNYAFALSDPATTPAGYNNYTVAWPSVSPGGIVWIPDYYLPWLDFQGQNAGPLPNTGPYMQELLPQSFTFQFNTAGTYTYHCTLYPYMTGTIVVQPSDGPSVYITGSGFYPDTAITFVGGGILWLNSDTIPHTTTSNTGQWDSGPLNPGEIFLHVFNNPGTYPYHCTYHPSKTGAIKVISSKVSQIHDVSIYDFYFSPQTLTIPAGESVRWTNYGRVSHTSTSDQGIWDSGILLPYYDPTLPVIVEVEQAIVVSPGPLKMSGTVESSKAYETENNQGGIEAFGVDFGSGLKSGLYYGTLIKGNSQDNLTCDYGDYAPLHTFKPLGPPVVDTFIVAGAAGDYTIQQLTLKFAHPILPLEITKYAFGVWIPEGGTEECEYAIEDVFVIENTGVDPIEGLKDGMWLDLDISAGGTGDLADFNQKYRSIWMYDAAAPDSVFGMTKKPLVVGDKAITGYSISQALRVYDGQYMDSLYYWMENLGWGIDDPTTPEDRSIILVDTNYTLAPGEMRMEKYLKWGYPAVIAAGGDDPAWKTFLYLLLHQEGFYRGDVNQDGSLNFDDILYLKAYLASGPPPKEFADQGDVNCDGIVDSLDVKYLKAFLCKGGGGPAPIDKNRFLLNSPFVDPAHKALGTRNPGLFGDPDWKDLSGGVTFFLCGDANGIAPVNVADVIYLINYLFKGGPAPLDVCDVNLDGKTNVTDVIYLINWLFKGGPNPCGCP